MLGIYENKAESAISVLFILPYLVVFIGKF